MLSRVGCEKRMIEHASPRAPQIAGLIDADSAIRAGVEARPSHDDNDGCTFACKRWSESLSVDAVLKVVLTWLGTLNFRAIRHLGKPRWRPHPTSKDDHEDKNEHTICARRYT